MQRLWASTAALVNAKSTITGVVAATIAAAGKETKAKVCAIVSTWVQRVAALPQLSNIHLRLELQSTCAVVFTTWVTCRKKIKLGYMVLRRDVAKTVSTYVRPPEMEEVLN